MLWRRKRQRGHSLLELLFAVGILLIISAVAVPNLSSVYRTYVLNSNANSLSGVVQRTRSVAVAQNAPANLSIDANNLFTVNSTSNTPLPFKEQQMALDRNIQVSTNPPKRLTTDDLGSSSLTVITTADTVNKIYFNARGIPCDPTATNCMTPLPKSAYVFYLTDGVRWAAVSVNPAGRVAVWSFAGKKWQQHR